MEQTAVGPVARGWWPVALRVLRAAAVGSLACAIAGVPAGALARAAMRAVALAMHQFPSFSWPGTLMIVIGFALLGALLGIVYAGLRHILPLGRAGRGLVWGLALALGIGGLILSGPIQEEGTAEVVPLAAALFGGLLLAWGALTEVLYEPLDRRLLRGGGRAGMAAQAALVALPALAGAALVLLQALGVRLGE